MTPLDGFTPYRPEDAALYQRKRWWLGLTLGDLLDRAADLHPDREALVGFDPAAAAAAAVGADVDGSAGGGGHARYTWAQLRAEADLLAYRLLESGLRRGDRVLLQLPNRAEFVVAYFALQKAGLVMVLLTVNHTAREVAHLARLTEPRGWVVPARYRKTQYGPLIAACAEREPGPGAGGRVGRGGRLPGRAGIRRHAAVRRPARRSGGAGRRGRGPRGCASRPRRRVPDPALRRHDRAAQRGPAYPRRLPEQRRVHVPRRGTSPRPTPVWWRRPWVTIWRCSSACRGPVFHAAPHGDHRLDLPRRHLPRHRRPSVSPARPWCPRSSRRLVAYEGATATRPLHPGTSLRRRGQQPARPGAIGRTASRLPLRERLRHGRGPLLAVAPRGCRMDPLRDHRPARESVRPVRHPRP